MYAATTPLTHTNLITASYTSTTKKVGLPDLEALQPAVAHSMARMLDPAGFSDADFAALDQRFELSYEAYGALKVGKGMGEGGVVWGCEWVRLSSND